MSILADTRPSGTAPARPTDSHLKVTARRVLRSEWAKLWSLRSTWITLGLGLLFLLAFGTIAALRYKSTLNSGQPMDPDFADATAYSLALFGVPFSLIALGVLGVLTASGEYTSGMIRSTLAAVPRRLPVLWSKAVVYGVIGVALGTVLRSTAGGISALVGTFLLVPGLMSLLPKSWRADLTPYLPSDAGESVYALHRSAGTLSAGAGLLVLLGWTALALGGAAYRLMRSDA
jgi:hypothetical protein